MTSSTPPRMKTSFCSLYMLTENSSGFHAFSTTTSSSTPSCVAATEIVSISSLNSFTLRSSR